MKKKKNGISVSALIIFMIVVVLIIAIVILVQKNNQYSEKVAQLETSEGQLEEKQERNVTIENEATNEIVNTNKATNTSNNVKNNNDKVAKGNNMKNEIVGNWSPSSATENGEEISLQEVYGSAISYGGYLTFNEDGTYTEFIGVYSPETEDDLQGTYTVSGNTITLSTKAGTQKVLDYSDDVIEEEIYEGTYVSFEKAE